MSAEVNPDPDELSAQTGQLIEYEKADVISPRIYPPRNVLVVSGRKPWANMTVTLRPVTYVDQPEYWRVEVIGTVPTIGQPAIVPYMVELPLAEATGTAGVEVIGSNGSEKIDL